MRYLCIGLTISVILIHGSCITHRYKILGEYRFVNDTNYTITFSSGSAAGFVNIGPKSTKVINEEMVGEQKKSVISNYASPYRYFGPELNIKFNNVKCLTNVKEDDINSLRNIKNFVAERVSDKAFKFTYTFTEADYNRAVTCP